MAQAHKRPPSAAEWDAHNPIRVHGTILPPESRFDISPANTGLPFLVHHGESINGVKLGRWGVIPAWWKQPKLPTSTFNATAEKVTDKKGMWPRLFKSRRCLVPMSGFYEWQQQPDGTTVRHFIRLRDHELFTCAGLWDEWTAPSGDRVTSFTIITCPANPLMAKIHNKPREGGPRMPVIIDMNAEDEWLEPFGEVGQSDNDRLLPLLTPYPQEQMIAYPVRRSGDGPALVKPVGPVVA